MNTRPPHPGSGSDMAPLFEHTEREAMGPISRFNDSETASSFGDGQGGGDNPEDLAGRMGQAFVQARKLTQEEVTRVIQLQRRQRIRFGEAAISLGLLTEDDVHEVLAQQFNYQTIAKHGAGAKKKISSRLLISHSPYSVEAEAMRRFRAEILLRAGDQPCLAIAMVSPNPKEGKSHISASLAIAFAQSNLKTLLIDANLRKPTQHLFFDLRNKTGLSTMLAGRTLPTLDLSHAITPNLNVITAGPKPPNPSEILGSPNLSDLLDKFRSEVRVIIIDTPPTRVGADAQIIAPQAGHAIVICRKDLSSVAAIRKTHRDMETASVNVLGSFFNDVPDTAVDPQVGWVRRLLGSLRAPGNP